MQNYLPSYLGFGRLRPESLLANEDIISADYYFNEQPVHRLTHNKKLGKWEIMDIYDKGGNISCASELKNVVLMHFNNLDCCTDSIFQFVRNEVIALGNIYFENLSSMQDEGGTVSYFPAGRLVIFRLPIFFDDSGKTKADILLNKIPYLEEEKRYLLKVCEAYNTSIISMDKSGTQLIIPVLMVEYIVTLASVFDVAKWVSENNLTGESKIFRMIIQDSKLKNQHRMQMFEGDANDEYPIFTMVFKGLDDEKIKFEDFEKKIIDGLNESQ